MISAKQSVIPAVIVVFLAWSGTAVATDRVVARVNGSPIMERQIEEAVDRLIPQASFHGSLTKERLDVFREKALEQLINFELQYQYALARGLKPDRKEVTTRMQKVRDSFSSKQEYRDWLKRVGRTEDEIRDMFEKDSLVQAARKKVVEAPSLTSEQQLREYYDSNMSKFNVPETAHLRIISTKNRQKAEEALAKVAKGEDFGDIAARMSEDSYRIKGGDIGYVHRGRIYPEVEDVAFRLAIGEHSGVFEAQGMWYVVKLEDRKAEQVMPFAEARESLKKELENRKRSELAEAWIADLRKKAVIERTPLSRPTGT